MGRKYHNPPLVEAVCEFRFTDTVEWPLTIPGVLYERIKTQFPTVERRQIASLTITDTPDGKVGVPSIVELAMLYSDDRKSLVQIGRGVCSVHVLAPYPTWSKYRPMIESIYEQLAQLLPENSPVKRLGLRYINRISFPAPDIKLKDWFNLFPYVNETVLPTNLRNFAVVCVFPSNEERDQCKVQLVSEEVQDEKMYANLDLDYYTEVASTSESPSILKWIETAHNNLEALFEGVITDNTRQMFEVLE